MPTLIKYRNGQQEPLTIQPLTMTERYRFIDHLVAGETPQIVALCTKRNIEWVNSLQDDCYLDLVRELLKENFSMAMKIATADPIAGIKVGPLLLQMGRMMTLLPGVSGLTSALSPTSAATPKSDAPNSSSSPSAPPAAAAAPAASAG